MFFTFSVGWVRVCISCFTSEGFNLYLHAVYGVGDGDLFTDEFSTFNVDPVKVNSEGKKVGFFKLKFHSTLSVLLSKSEIAFTVWKCSIVI